MTESENQFNQAAARFNREMNEKAKTKDEWSFVDGLTKFMERNHLNQRELGRKLGLSHMAVGKWLSKDNEPNLASLKRLIKLGMNANEIFGTSLSKIMLSKQ